MIRKRYYINLFILVILMGVLISLLFTIKFGQNTFFLPLGIGLSIIIIMMLIFRHIKNLENTFSSFLEHIKTEQYGFQTPPGFNRWMTNQSKAEIQSIIGQLKNRSLDHAEKRQLTQSIIDQIPIAVIGLQAGNQIVFTNKAARHLFEVDKPPTFDFINAKWKALTAFIHQPTTDSTILPRQGSGGTRQYAIERSTIKQPNLRLQLITIHDISKELTEKELASWQQLLRTLTHEINNTLTPILSLVEATHDTYLPQLTSLTPETRTQKAYIHIEESLHLIAERSKNLKRFINNYRKITPKHPVQQEPVVIADILYKLRILFSTQLEENSITWQADLSEKIHEVNADRSYLEQILINLVKNAIESMKGKERKITIKSTAISSKQIAISICDTGGGINEEKLPHIFTPFYTTKKEGNGIGLTLCKQIMHMHKGQISIASEPGEGTTVKLLFPCE